MALPIITAEAVADLIRPGDCITFSPRDRNGPTDIQRAIEARFLKTGEPQGLTWFEIFGSTGYGAEPLSHIGLLKRVVHGWLPPFPNLCEMINSNQVEAYIYPLGTLAYWTQQIGAGRSGYLTPTGIGTYMDPRQGGGRLNDVTTEEYVSVVEVDGEEHLWFKAQRIDVAIISGTSVDEAGNLSLEEEQFTKTIVDQALAAKRWGGKVIARAKRVVREGEIHPRMVVVPGVMVDAIVIETPETVPAPNPIVATPVAWTGPTDRLTPAPAEVLGSGNPAALNHWMQEGIIDPELIGRPSLSADRVLGRRAALEIRRGTLVNCGMGTPCFDVFPIALQERVDEECVLSMELGRVGGVQEVRLRYHNGCTSVLDSPTIFGLYATERLDVTFLGMLEFDREGSVNLLKYGDTWIGPGGAMDIAQFARKVVFMGTLRAGGLEIGAGDGQLHIRQEGRFPRAVEQVQAICFNGPKMYREGKEVLYITERAVFRLTGHGLRLTEIAPGVDLERDVLEQMEFRPEVAAELKIMDPRIYHEALMGLREDWGLPPVAEAAATAPA